jgi:hypothetical protein
MADLETFIANTKALPSVVDVEAKEPTAFMLKQIGTKWNLSRTPTWFTFHITSDKGNVHPIDMIIPFEIWGNIKHARVDQLLMAANRYDNTPSRHTFFLRPDIIDSEVLLGTTITPIAKASIPAGMVNLGARIKKIPTVSGVNVYPVIDPELIAQYGSDALHLEVLIKDISNIRVDALNLAIDGSYDRYFNTVPKSVWNSLEVHESFAIDVDNIIRGKKRIDDINLDKGIKLR